MEAARNSRTTWLCAHLQMSFVTVLEDHELRSNSPIQITHQNGVKSAQHCRVGGPPVVQ
jgi:hypothetical protein